MNKVYTAQEVADKLKIKKSTVYDLIKRGELSSSKVGKQLRVSEEQLSQYLKGSECSASSALEWLKKVTGYNRLIQNICMKIG